MPLPLSSLLLAALAVLAVLAAAALWWAGRRRADAFLTGMWGGDPGFLARAGLADFQLYVGPPDRKKGGRPGYLIIADEKMGLLANQPVRVRAAPGAALGCALRARGDRVRGPLLVEGGGLPPLRMTMSVLDGTLTLHDGKSVFAFLGKDHLASAAAAAALAAPPAPAPPGPNDEAGPADSDADSDGGSGSDGGSDSDGDSAGGSGSDGGPEAGAGGAGGAEAGPGGW